MNLPSLDHLMLLPLQAKGSSSTLSHIVGPTVGVPGERSVRSSLLEKFQSHRAEAKGTCTITSFSQRF